MLLRDKIANDILKQDPNNVEKINSKDELVNELIENIQIYLNDFKITKNQEILAEIDECIEFIKIFNDFPSLFFIREEMKEKYGLYWAQMKKKQQ